MASTLLAGANFVLFLFTRFCSLCNQKAPKCHHGNKHWMWKVNWVIAALWYSTGYSGLLMESKSIRQSRTRFSVSAPAQLLMLCGRADAVHQPACFLIDDLLLRFTHADASKVHLKLVFLSRRIRGHRDEESCTFHPLFLCIFFRLSAPLRHHGDLSRTCSVIVTKPKFHSCMPINFTLIWYLVTKVCH